ncbi:hypothetical protein [Azotobacter vinelandii]
MMAFYETYSALVQHLRDSLPAGVEITEAQHELLGSAEAHLDILQAQCNEARNVAAMAEDLQSALDNPARLQQLLDGTQPGRSLFMPGIKQVADFAAYAASFLTHRY